MPPGASFLLPFRNAGATLGEALDSIRAQTRKDWEAVLVDDGSKDAGPGIAARYAARDPRFRLFRLRPGRGLPSALKFGVSRCRAPLIARLDADDRALPGRLELQCPRFEEDPRLAVVDGGLRLFRDRGEVPEGMRRWASWIGGIKRPEDFGKAILKESPVVHPAATIRRSALIEVGGYRDGDFPEDHDLWLRLHARGWRFARVGARCVEMRDREDRLTRTHPRYRKEAFRKLVMEHVGRHLLPGPGPLVLWGAGRGGRPWLRFLRSRGVVPAAVIDVDPSRIGTRLQGTVPVVPPPALEGMEAAWCLVAVGARDALPEIRVSIGALRPDWREGRDWWAVAT